MLVHSFEIDIEETIKNTFPLGKLPSQWHNQMMSIHKVSALLGRIENHAVNIAESAAALINKSEEISLYLVQIYISKMADITETLLGDSLNCFFHPDGIVARRIQNSDNQFCALIQSMTNRIKDMVLKETIPFESAVELSHIFKNLEQIAENSVTIAEKVNCAELQKSPTKFIGGSHQAVSHRDTISAEKV
jgi:phosphate transport system protein